MILLQSFGKRIPVALAILALAAVAAAPANAQANLTFSGGSGAPITMTLLNPVTYNITTSAGLAPLFAFQSVGDIFAGGYFATSTLNFSINGGPAQTLEIVYTRSNGGAITANDVYAYSSTGFPGVSVGDVVTLSAGSLTSLGNIAEAAPANGSYNTFVVEGNGLTRVSGNGGTGSTSAPEPGTLAFLAVGTFAGGVVIRRRKR